MKNDFNKGVISGKITYFREIEVLKIFWGIENKIGGRCYISIRQVPVKRGIYFSHN
jgi:hypothetical protein